MCASRAVPSGKVYRQLFDAQVQLSRSLLAGRKDTRTDCLSAEDSNTHCSTTSRLLFSSSSRGQQVGDDDDVEDVRKLPDSPITATSSLSVGRPSSDIIERLTEKKRIRHEEALKQLDAELTAISQVCETQVRTVSQELLSSQQEVDLRLDKLKDSMGQLEHLDHVSLQEVCALWEQVEKEVMVKKMRIMELNHRLTECETQRTDKIRAVLRKFCHLLVKISFLRPPDVHRLIHTEATMLNQSLLANRRSAARLLLLLQEENLQQESLLHLHWKDCLSRWRTSRITDVMDGFRRLCRSDEDQHQRLISGLQMEQTHGDLTERRRDLICRISSLVPPTCSTALVSDWFSQLTAVNQQIDCLHADFLHQLRGCYEHTWQERLAVVESCKEALSALQLSDEEVNHVIGSQLLSLIGRSQSQDEERLAALDVCCDSVARRALSLSRCVVVVMRGAALLWEMHSCRLERREEEVQQQLDDLRHSQQRRTQRRKVWLDNLLGRLRQESSEDTLKTTLDKTVLYLQDIKQSCRQSVSDQWEVLDRLPSVFLEELLSYSSSLSSLYHLKHTYTPSPEELQNLHLSPSNPTNLETSVEAEIQEPEEVMENPPVSCQNDVDPAPPSQDWLIEAESSLLSLCDIRSQIKFTSSRGITYTAPAFGCPAPSLPEDLQQETHLSQFPVELLTHTLSRTRTLFLDHLEQHFHDVLSSAVAMVTDRKEAVCSEQELQLQQLNPQDIQTHVYQPRLAELQLHQQQVEVHCGEVLDALTSCRTELQELQTSISRKNQELTITLSNIEDNILKAHSSQRLEAVSSTLQDRLDQHNKYTQRCLTTFRQTVQLRLEKVRQRTTQLLNSFRTFSEGGEFAPQEVKMFQMRLKEETKRISVTEESICSELDVFESRSLQQVKEASGRCEEKLSLLKSELRFMEKIHKMISSTQVHMRAEAASSNQQQSVISSRLEDVRRMMENTQVSPHQVLALLSSVSEELRTRCQYLDFELEGLALPARPKSRKQVQSSPPPVLLQPSRTGVDVLDDPVVSIIKSLNRRIQQDQQRQRTGDQLLVNIWCGLRFIHRLSTDAATGTSQSAVSVRAAQCDGCGSLPGRQQEVPSLFKQLFPAAVAFSADLGGASRSIRTDRRFQIFGPKPETEQNTRSFSSTVNCVLWKVNDAALLVAEDFYRSERLGRFQLLPDTLDQWAESMQQRLLGYQEQARRFLSTSREDLVNQLSELDDLLRSSPAVLISNYEQQKGVELKEEVGRVQKKLEEMLSASEQEKTVNVWRLRASLREDELQMLIGREELRQQRLQSAICCSYLELQDCVRVQGEEFVTSLASLTENLINQLDNLLTPTETKAASYRHSEDSSVTMVTGTELGPKPCTGSRTWSGISYLSLPTSNTADPPSPVTTATTASITTTRCTLGHLAIIEQRDTAVKRFEQLFSSELLCSDDNKQKQLRELQSWNTHWRQQIHNLTH
ncbi:coiled-coil domain-containing protein 180 [Toxotes jaculatrix]|uniref:coiled-coil domain-containing protein 180 n=1 Tax=Toxotes jaculatrix TaxID=941984 RepID=UPI001B3A930E|nr:coiled-coil domain-containing protein 180 [Toxotes jaculatrix]